MTFSILSVKVRGPIKPRLMVWRGVFSAVSSKVFYFLIKFEVFLIRRRFFFSSEVFAEILDLIESYFSNRFADVGSSDNRCFLYNDEEELVDILFCSLSLENFDFLPLTLVVLDFE